MIDAFEGPYRFLSYRYPVLVRDRDGQWCGSVAAAHPLTWDEWMDATQQKFKLPELRAKLLATGDEEIVGVLGKTLMEVRNECRDARVGNKA
jgi:hypothetical protein